MCARGREIENQKQRGKKSKTERYCLEIYMFKKRYTTKVV